MRHNYQQPNPDTANKKSFRGKDIAERADETKCPECGWELSSINHDFLHAWYKVGELMERG